MGGAAGPLGAVVGSASWLLVVHVVLCFQRLYRAVALSAGFIVTDMLFRGMELELFRASFFPKFSVCWTRTSVQIVSIKWL